MIAPSNEPGRRAPRPTTPPAMVKYWLPELLAEVEIERASGHLGLEKIPQGDIAKLFQAQTKRRRVPPRR